MAFTDGTSMIYSWQRLYVLWVKVHLNLGEKVSRTLLSNYNRYDMQNSWFCFTKVTFLYKSKDKRLIQEVPYERNPWIEEKNMNSKMFLPPDE